MPGEELLLLLLGGGSAVAIASGKKPAATGPTQLNSSGAVMSAGTWGIPIGGLLGTKGRVPVGVANRLHLLRSGAVAPMPPRGDVENGKIVTWGSGSFPIDTARRAKQDKIDQYASAVYDHLGVGARQAGAAYLNSQLGLDPPLNGSESWDTASKRVGAAVGSAAGAAAGEYLGGPVGAYIGQMVGAYLGAEITDLMNQGLDEIGPWFEDRWSDVESWVSGAYNDVSNAVGDAASAIGDAGESVGDAANQIGDGIAGLF